MRKQPRKLIGLLSIIIIPLLVSGSVEDGDLLEHQEEIVTDQNEIAQAKVGDTIRVHYTGTLDDGTVFDSSVGRKPLEFTIGMGQMLQATQLDGQIILVTLTNVTDSNVTLDANHRLAGKNLTFEIQLVEIVSSA